MVNPDWDERSRLGILCAVIDPYDKQGFKNRLIDRVQWNAIKKALNGSKSLLDFGCGTGRFASRIKELGVNYFGVDSSVEMIQMAKEYHQNFNLNFVHFDGCKTPFADQRFDTCLSCGVFQYIIKGPGSQKVIAEMRRVLVPGGRLIMVEQASLSNQSSGSVSRSATEADYTDEISKSFSVKSLHRIRSCRLSQLTRNSFRFANRFPRLWEHTVNYLAEKEIQRAKKLGDSYFSSVEYYDIIIETLAR